MVLERDSNPFNRWFAEIVFERFGGENVGDMGEGDGMFARPTCFSETTVSSIPIDAMTFFSPDSSLCRNFVSASNLHEATMVYRPYRE